MCSHGLRLRHQTSFLLLTVWLPHTAPAASTELFFSEYVEGSSNNKALEIYNGTGATIDLAAGNYMIHMSLGISNTHDINLVGTIAAGDVFVIARSLASFLPANGGSISADQTDSSNIWFNGDDAIVLKKGGPSGTIVDSIGQVGFDPGTEWGSGFISTADNTLRRKSSIATGDTNSADAFTPAVEWDGYATNTFCGLGTYLDATKIHTLQGNGLTSPQVGQVHLIEGIVTGDFQANTQLNGFFVQEEATDVDTDPTTSEGIFVYDNNFGIDVSVGQVVRVQGTVQEFYGLTELNNITSISVCSNGTSVTPTPITLPLTSNIFLERYEGMLVRLPQTLTVSDNNNLGRYGEVLLSNGRLLIPTMTTTPGNAANILQAQNDLNRLFLDDGSSLVNPPLIPYPSPFLSTTHTLRNGDTVTGVTGILDYNFGEYRLHPTTPPAFIATNPRPSSPTAVGGTLKIASFNLDNYFNTFSGCYVSCRGAENSTEFTRQRDKIINALKIIDADIVGLMEVENDGYDPNSAIQDLVTGLNAATAPGTYTFIDADAALGITNALGADAIKVAMLYKPATVTPVGVANSLHTGAFANQNRPPLAQTFRQIISGGTLTVVVNHFKSKGSNTTGNLADDDQGDGQGMSNATRVAAARELTTWLATDPTHSGDSNFLLIGDLNAYALEDPLMVIKSAGYTDLVQKFIGTTAYSYTFAGPAGYLDHALASANLLHRIMGITEWHINADEPSVLDYNDNDKTAGQLVSLYSADPYRTSDHDPLIIGLTLMDSAPAVISTTPANGASNVALHPDLAISFNEEVNVTDQSVTLHCSSGGLLPVTMSGNGANYTLTPSSDFTPGDTCTITVLATQVSDVDTNDPPDQMTSNYSWSFTTLTLPPSKPAQALLFVSVDGLGTGRVISNPAGLDCNHDKCQYPFDLITSVTLTPIAADGSKFSSWGGDSDCADGEVVITSNKLCIAYFALLPPPLVTLTVTPSGTGTGTITSMPAGINCGPTCQASFNVDTAVTLMATPAANSQFTGFRGDADCSEGNVTLKTAKTCQAIFELPLSPSLAAPPPVTVNLSLHITGNGTVTSTPAGIDCGMTCAANYPSGTTINLVALPAENYQFAGFTGDDGCLTGGPLELETDMSCTANFIEVAATLPQFSAPRYETPAGANVVIIPVKRTMMNTDSPLTVNYATQNGTAIAGQDYVATQGSLTWLAGDLADKTIAIILLDSTTIGTTEGVKGEKLFNLILMDATGSQIDLTTVSLLTDTPPSSITLPESNAAVATVPSELMPSLPEEEMMPSPPLSSPPSSESTSPPVAISPASTPILTPIPTVEESSSPDWFIETPACPTEGRLDWTCNAQWRTLHNLEIGPHGQLSSGVLEGTINNQGWVSNLVIKPQSQVIGGVVTGYITNEGQLSDFEFVGMSVIGGTLSGTILNHSLVGGYFQEVHLAAHTQIRGGKLRGNIIGDTKAPALLEDLVIMPGSRLVGIKLGKGVKVANDVKID